MPVLKTPPLEKKVERKCRAWAKKQLGIFSLKLQLQHDAGWPDVVFLLPYGYPWFVEFKREDEEPRDLQVHRHETLKELGYLVEVIDNFGDFCVRLREALRTVEASSRSEAGDQVSP